MTKLCIRFLCQKPISVSVSTLETKLPQPSNRPRSRRDSGAEDLPVKERERHPPSFAPNMALQEMFAVRRKVKPGPPYNPFVAGNLVPKEI
jgi:hypothetical protein